MIIQLQKTGITECINQVGKSMNEHRYNIVWLKTLEYERMMKRQTFPVI